MVERDEKEVSEYTQHLQTKINKGHHVDPCQKWTLVSNSSMSIIEGKSSLGQRIIEYNKSVEELSARSSTQCSNFQIVFPVTLHLWCL